MSCKATSTAVRARVPTSGPVIFLDIDGVLNRTAGAQQIIVEPPLVARLKRLLQQSGACIVLSTFWRHFGEYIAYVLHRHGIDAGLVIGSTPGQPGSAVLSASAFDDAEYSSRAAEILAWLDAHPTVSRFVILDDRPSAANASTQPHFVHTVAAAGLSDDDCAKALKILSQLVWSPHREGGGGPV